MAGAASGGLLFATLFFGGGTSEARLFWLGSVTLVVAGAAGAAALGGLLPVPRLGRVGVAFVLALAVLAAWAGASLSWSIVPDRSWIGFDRAIVYVAYAVIGVFVGALLPRAPRSVALGLAALLGAVLGWALLGKVFPSLYAEPPASPITRLRNPVGYWNALALLGDAALPLALWVAARRRLRAAGAVLFYVAVIAILLTYSRTGVVVGAVAIVAWIALERERLESLAITGLAAAPALGVSIFAFTRGGLTSFDSPARERDGAWFGLLLLVGAIIVAVLATVLSQWEPSSPDRRRRLERRLAGTITAAAVVAVTGLAFRAGGPSEWWRDFTNPVVVSQGSSQFGNDRWRWWKEAWQLFEDEPLEGHGANSFSVARRPIRKNPLVVTEPHNTALQLLSELGIVGFLLGGTAAAAALAAAAGAIRRAAAKDRLPAVALALGLGAYGVHALVDYDWEFVAVTGPVLFVAGVLAATGRPVIQRRRLVPAGIAVVAVLAALYSLGAPWLANRRVEQSYSALDREDVSAASSRARSAHRLNPLSYEPYWALAAAALTAGDDRAALLAYERAAELQPENSDTWYALGQYEFETGRFALACYALDLAYRLDPRGPAGEPGGLLDQAKQRLPGCPAA